MEQSSAQKQNLNLHRVIEREKSDPWFVNLTDVQVPDSVQDILRLGKGFSSNMINHKSKQMIEVLKDIEANIHKIPGSDPQDLGTRFCTYPRDWLRKKVCI